MIVEGPSDRGMAEAVLREAGQKVGSITVRGGKTKIDPLLSSYNRAARHSPLIVFRDTDTKCPLELRKYLTHDVEDMAPGFMLRLVHPMTEGWLLSDKYGFARYFHVSPGKIPTDTGSLVDAKSTLLALCMKSTSRDIRAEVVRKDGKTGPLYTDHLNEFASRYWDVAAASEQNDSLRRAVERIRVISAS
ncbi:hypothetical protein [Gordonia soli]|uniref:hypothetical protein n=1 Tax=Gordonia soli TaxID=320799 RepID=UPI0012FCB0EB|nr:hypothetical protein [Gordonia soli]